MVTEEQRSLADHYRNKMHECGVPGHLIDGLALYIVHGTEPGGCLTAILANDLMEAFGRADHMTAAGMKEICTFIYSYAPSRCHGSYERIDEWMRARRAEVEFAESKGVEG